jgi:hypothetical protein
MAKIRSLRTEDIPSALALWQGTSAANSRGVESVAGPAPFVGRNPECSRVARKDDNADELKFWKSLGLPGRKDTMLLLPVMKSEGRDDS